MKCTSHMELFKKEMNNFLNPRQLLITSILRVFSYLIKLN